MQNEKNMTWTLPLKGILGQRVGAEIKWVQDTSKQTIAL